MTKKYFIALADAIKENNKQKGLRVASFTPGQIDILAKFCKSQNPAFNKERWIDHINGKCGPNGGKVGK